MAQIRVVKAGSTGLVLHKASHEPGGEDALTNLTDASFVAANKDGLAAVPSLRTLGTGGNQALPGNHVSTTNARTPTTHKANHEPGGSDPMTVDAAAATGSLRTLGTGATQSAAGDHLHDLRYVRTVNGVGPDETGNVAVAGGGGGSAGVGSIDGISPNAAGGNIDLTSSDSSVVLAGNNTTDTLDITVPGLATHAALAVDPTDTNTTRNKHVSNSDLNKLRDVTIPPHCFKGALTITTGTGKVPIMRDSTLVSIRAQVGTAPTGANIVLSIRLNGTSIGTVTITAGATEGTLTLSQALTAGQSLTVNITQVGSTVAGADLTVGYLARLI
jgi:hypothetical protein